MAETDWFRRATWTDEDQADFIAHLRRCRSSANKAQYLRIQALHLQETGAKPLIMAALGLLEQLVRECPERTELASVYLQQGECRMALGKGDDAIESLRQSLEFQRGFPFA